MTVGSDGARRDAAVREQVGRQLSQIETLLIETPDGAIGFESLSRRLVRLKAYCEAFGLEGLGATAGEMAALAQAAGRGEAGDPAVIGEQLSATLAALWSRLSIASDYGVTRLAAVGAGQRTPLIFIVDADPWHAGHVAEQLERSGFAVQRFAIAADAVIAAADQPPDALLIDPGLGEQGTSELDSIPVLLGNLAQRPVVFVLTGRRDFEARMAALTTGADGYFVKPANLLQLADRLQALLAARLEVVPGRVLVVDDQAPVAAFYAAILRQGGLVAETLSEPSRALDVIESFRPDAVLLDLDLGAVSGYQVAAVIRQEWTEVELPIVFLSGGTGVDGLTAQVDALRHGGEQFLLKTVDPAWIVLVLRARAQRATAVRLQRAWDRATGLMRYRPFVDALEREIARCRRHHQPLTLAVADIDGLRAINVRHGRPVGDRVIELAARTLQSRLRRSDLVGRLGGDSFGLILTQTPAADARRIVFEAARAFADSATALRIDPALAPRLSISAGLGELGANPDDSQANPAALLWLAREGLTKAKAGACGSVVLAEPRRAA